MAGYVITDDGLHLFDYAVYTYVLQPYFQVRLYQNSLEITRDTVLGDLLEADFSNYAPVTLSDGWSDFYKDANGIWSRLSKPYNFAHDGGATGNSIYGIYVVPPDLSRLICAAEFWPTGKDMRASGDTIDGRIQFKYQSLYTVSPQP